MSLSPRFTKYFKKKKKKKKKKREKDFYTIKLYDVCITQDTWVRPI
jgi:hypothetical protein